MREEEKNIKITIAIAIALIVSFALLYYVEHGTFGRVLLALIILCMLIKVLWKLLIWMLK